MEICLWNQSITIRTIPINAAVQMVNDIYEKYVKLGYSRMLE